MYYIPLLQPMVWQQLGALCLRIPLLQPMDWQQLGHNVFMDSSPPALGLTTVGGTVFKDSSPPATNQNLLPSLLNMKLAHNISQLSSTSSSKFTKWSKKAESFFGDVSV